MTKPSTFNTGYLYQGKKALIVKVIMFASALFQVRRMVSGKVAYPTSVERSCSKPFTTCWSAAS